MYTKGSYGFTQIQPTTGKFCLYKSVVKANSTVKMLTSPVISGIGLG